MTTRPDAEFRALLAAGRGRAHLVLEARPGDRSLRDALIDACLTSDELPLEDSRAPYLFELVCLAGATDELAAALADPFAGDPGGDDLEQRFALVGLLARDGVPGMREVVYGGQERLVDRWLAERPEWPPSIEPTRQLIALDGLRGGLVGFAQLGRVALAGGSHPYLFDELVEAARNALDGEEADRIFAEARARDRRIDAFLRAVEDPAAVDVSGLTPPDGWCEAPWSVVREAIERSVAGGRRAFTSAWGEGAAQDQLVLAARDLVALPRRDTEVLLEHVGVFSRRPFPLDPAPLIELIAHLDRRVARGALDALRQLRHPSVRAAALDMVDGPRREHALDLLARNWEPGDEHLAERLLSADDLDGDRAHTLSIGLARVFEQQPLPQLAPALILSYGADPCALCRERTVAALLQLDALPGDVRTECRWDANQSTRDLVLES